MKRRRVLFVDHTAVLGGGELSLLDLATAYSETSQVLLFSDGPFRSKLEAAQVRVSLIPMAQSLLSLRASGGASALASLPALWQAAQQVADAGRDFEVVHANSQKAFIVAILATFLGSPPVVWHLRDILTARHFSRLNRRVAIALANARAAKVFVNSRATGEAFVAAGGHRHLLSLVYNGFSTNAFDEPTDCQIRQQLNIGQAPLVGTFSRLSYWKGQHVLLEALQELPGVHALLVGEPLFGEVEYAAKLKALAAEPELAHRVHWLGFRDDIPALMKACDLVVHTSTEPEPFGRVIVEGQLAQRPVVASASGGALEIIEDGVTGCLVTPDCPAALANTIGQLLAEPKTAAAIAAAGAASARTNFSLAACLHAFDHALHTI